MTRCAECGAPIQATPDGTGVCAACTLRLGLESAETEAEGPLSRREKGLLPGTTIGGRYRIVSPLGRGGMGEVYRADDLKLGQPVALKFLSARRNDSRSIERFLNEVKLARGVAHPNVCRVYDVGEVDGHHFLCMEYVDGEDLAALLRRIGRIPPDKATQLARQICAGLAAAHEQGILHRDLKPANVMIDGRGRARVTDFGLARLAADDDLDGVVGTPTYMAPEQAAGGEVTVRSDVYALGLLLYELFTGRRAFEARTPAEMLDWQRSSTPSSPSSVVDGLDPAVERTILRCLEADPAQRPASVLAVAAALPGGDPLTEALAAGETPSPELVAAAGSEGTLRRPLALTLLGLLVLGFILVGLAHGRATVLGRGPVPKPPPVLEERSRELLARIGYPDRPHHSASGFVHDVEYLEWIEAEDDSVERWDALATEPPSSLLYWYEESPQPVTPTQHEYIRPALPPEPTYAIPGTASLRLDASGRLVRFGIVPRRPEDVGRPADADWRPLFEAAGLELEHFEAVEPDFTPPVFADRRSAWEGRYPTRSDLPLRIEAASLGGRPVHFALMAPWSGSALEEHRLQTRNPTVATDVIFYVASLAALLYAWWNIRRGRGDRRGAFRVAMAVFATFAVGQLLRGYAGMAADVILSAISTWAFYVALEPIVRRRWPDSLIGWSRLLIGRFRDPLVGREVLIGMLFGTALAALARLPDLAFPALLAVAPLPIEQSLALLLGPAQVLADVLQNPKWAVTSALFLLFLFTVLRIALRKPWLAAVAMFVLLTIPEAEVPEPRLLSGMLLYEGLRSAIVIVILTRFGLLAFAAAQLCNRWATPVVFDSGLWYAEASWLALLFPLALASYACWISVGRRAALQPPTAASR